MTAIRKLPGAAAVILGEGENAAAPGVHPAAKAMSEDDLERAMRRILADLPSVLWYHTHDFAAQPQRLP